MITLVRRIVRWVLDVPYHYELWVEGPGCPRRVSMRAATRAEALTWADDIRSRVRTTPDTVTGIVWCERRRGVHPLTIQRLVVLSLLPTVLVDATILRLLVLGGLGLGFLYAAEHAAWTLGGPFVDTSHESDAGVSHNSMDPQ